MLFQNIFQHLNLACFISYCANINHLCSRVWSLGCSLSRFRSFVARYSYESWKHPRSAVFDQTFHTSLQGKHVNCLLRAVQNCRPCAQTVFIPPVWLATGKLTTGCYIRVPHGCHRGNLQEIHQCVCHCPHGSHRHMLWAYKGHFYLSGAQTNHTACNFSVMSVCIDKLCVTVAILCSARWESGLVSVNCAVFHLFLVVTQTWVSLL